MLAWRETFSSLVSYLSPFLSIFSFDLSVRITFAFWKSNFFEDKNFILYHDFENNFPWKMQLKYKSCNIIYLSGYYFLFVIIIEEFQFLSLIAVKKNIIFRSNFRWKFVTLWHLEKNLLNVLLEFILQRKHLQEIPLRTFYWHYQFVTYTYKSRLRGSACFQNIPPQE